MLRIGFGGLLFDVIFDGAAEYLSQGCADVGAIHNGCQWSDNRGIESLEGAQGEERFVPNTVLKIVHHRDPFKWSGLNANNPMLSYAHSYSKTT